MTESGGAACGTQCFDNTSGHVGGPGPCVKIKLRDVPEANYLHTNKPAQGEICIKSGAMMDGYFKNPEKTKEAFTDDGWLLTGDIANIYENGQIQIIDRAKSIFKLSQGEYISPEKVENILVQGEYLAQAYIHGDST